MKGILYIRVSSEEQARGFSLQSQELEADEYAKRKGINIVRKFMISESAKEEGRKVFNETIRYLINQPDIEAMLFFKIDRSHRNLWDMALVEEIPRKYKKQFHFYHDNFIYSKDSPVGDFYNFCFQSIIATGFSRNLSDITKLGMQRKAENGQYPGIAPFGYKNNTSTHLVEPDSLEAPWVVRIKKLAASEESIDSILEILKRENCQYKFARSKIERIIRSSFYYGYFEWGGQWYKGIYHPLVDKTLHDSGVRGLERLNKPKNRTQFIAYRGLMKCGSCGCAITGERRKEKYVYYHCTWMRGKCENTEYTREDKLEEQFEKMLANVSINEERAHGLLIELEKTAGQVMVQRESKVAMLKQECQRIQTRRDRAYEDKLDGKLSETDWLKKDRAWQEKILDMEIEIRQLENLNPAESLATLKRVLELSNRLVFQFESLPREKRAEFLKFVYWNLELKHKSLSFSYQKPFDIFAEVAVSGNWGG